MSISQGFKDTAQRLVRRFSEDIGDSEVTLRHHSNYDTATGTINPDGDRFIIPVAYSSFGYRERPVESHGSAVNKAFVAGLDLPDGVEINKNDFIRHPSFGEFQVVDVKKDMYKALYTLKIKWLRTFQ